MSSQEGMDMAQDKFHRTQTTSAQANDVKAPMKHIVPDTLADSEEMAWGEG